MNLVLGGSVAVPGVESICHVHPLDHFSEGREAFSIEGAVVVVVDEDIDASNLEDVMWALCFRADPATDIDIIQRGWSTGLDPSIHPDRKAIGDTTNSRAIINACKPFHWKDRYPKVNMPDPETYVRAVQKWGWLLNSNAPPEKENFG